MGEVPGAAARSGISEMINPTEYLPKTYRTRMSDLLVAARVGRI